VNSIQRRLTVGLLAATTILSLAAGLWLYAYVRAALIQQFDSSLAAKAHALAELLHFDKGKQVDLDFEPESMPEYLPGPWAEYFMVIQPGATGTTVITRSPSLGGNDLLDPGVVPSASAVWDLPMPDKQAGRALALTATPDYDDEDPDWRPGVKPPAVLVVVARSRAEVDRVMTALAGAMVVGAGILAVGGTLAVRYIVRHGLRPLNKLAEIAATIGPETLAYRFETDTLPTELQPIGQRMNDFLERLDQAFQRERRVNADIAHELRTPIAELRALTEVASRWPCDQTRTAEYFRDAGDIAQRMSMLVETLLALARGQSGRIRPRSENVELSPLIGQAVEVCRARAPRELSLTLSVADDQIVATDRVMFGRIVENLVANAFDYTPAGGRIRCSASRSNGHCDLIIANSNATLEESDLTRIFDPFWRKDAARTGDGHAGLGLSLVAEYARQLNISISPRLTAPDWFEMTLTIPAAKN
jgi:signal transduction histidine kinase